MCQRVCLQTHFFASVTMLIQFYFILQILAISIASSNVTQIGKNVDQKQENQQTKNVVFSDSGPIVPDKNIGISDNKNATEITHRRGIKNTENSPDDAKNASSKSTSNLKLVPETSAPKIPSILSTSSTASTSTSTTTTTTTSTTTTTPAPKKPLVTYSVEDDPELKPKIDKMNMDVWNSKVKLNTHDIPPEGPITLQSSEEMGRLHDARQYIVPMVGVIFAIPFLVIIGNSLRRGLRDYWSKRKYRRMDYLIEDMYN